MEARGSAGSTAPRIGGAWDRGSALQTSRTPETAPPKPVVFEVIALVMGRVTATLSKGKACRCKQAFGDRIGAEPGFGDGMRKNPSLPPRVLGEANLQCNGKIGAMCKRVQFGGPSSEIDGRHYRSAGRRGGLEAEFFSQAIVLTTEYFWNWDGWLPKRTYPAAARGGERTLPQLYSAVCSLIGQGR